MTTFCRRCRDVVETFELNYIFTSSSPSSFSTNPPRPLTYLCTNAEVSNSITEQVKCRSAAHCASFRTDPRQAADIRKGGCLCAHPVFPPVSVNDDRFSPAGESRKWSKCTAPVNMKRSRKMKYVKFFFFAVKHVMLTVSTEIACT